MYNNKTNPDIEAIELDEYVQSYFLDAILTQPEARNWSAEDYQDSSWYEVTVPKSSTEYKELAAKFYKTCSNYGISKIRRIQNPFMLGQFLLKREELSQKVHIKTKELFHGTTRDSLEGIFEDNFDWRRFGEHKGTRHGEGVNFTPRAGFATNFGDKYKNKRVMILAYVLVGKTCIGYQDMPLPDVGTDTAMKADGDVLVKFEDDEFYPAYVFYYYPRKG